MNKRSFFKSLLGGVAGLVSLPVLSKLPEPTNTQPVTAKTGNPILWPEVEWKPTELTINDFGAADTVDITNPDRYEQLTRLRESNVVTTKWIIERMTSVSFLPSSVGAAAWFPKEAQEGNQFWFAPYGDEYSHLVGTYTFHEGKWLQVSANPDVSTWRG